MSIYCTISLLYVRPAVAACAAQGKVSYVGKNTTNRAPLVCFLSLPELFSRTSNTRPLGDPCLGGGCGGQFAPRREACLSSMQGCRTQLSASSGRSLLVISSSRRGSQHSQGQHDEQAPGGDLQGVPGQLWPVGGKASTAVAERQAGKS